MFYLQSDIFNIFWLIIFFFMMFLYPKMLLYQLIARFSKTAELLDELSKKSKEKIISKIKKDKKEIREKINNFLDFFVITPVSLDPFGIIRKLEHLQNLEETRFKYFVDRIAENLDEEDKWNLISALSAGMAIHQLSKTVKHYIKLIEKTKSYQLGLILQMQLPLVEKFSKSLFKATEALVDGQPIGDSAGPLLAASFMKNEAKEIDNMVYSVEKFDGKTLIVMKAKGPGGRVGKIGRAVEKIVEKFKVQKIITVDAALKLESEKTGEVAEGIGVAIGGIGVEKAIIEELATKKGIPLDSYIIKMSQEEALMPMKEEVLKGVFEVKKRIEENLKESKERVILLVGVGNTCGVPNNNELDKVIEKIKIGSKKIKDWEEEEKKKEEKGWFTFGL